MTKEEKDYKQSVWERYWSMEGQLAITEEDLKTLIGPPTQRRKVEKPIELLFELIDGWIIRVNITHTFDWRAELLHHQAMEHEGISYDFMVIDTPTGKRFFYGHWNSGKVEEREEV